MAFFMCFSLLYYIIYDVYCLIPYKYYRGKGGFLSIVFSYRLRVTSYEGWPEFKLPWTIFCGLSDYWGNSDFVIMVTGYELRADNNY